MGANSIDDEERPKTKKRSFLKLVGTSALALGGVASAGVDRASASSSSIPATSLVVSEVNEEEEYFRLKNLGSPVSLSGAEAAIGYGSSAERRRPFPESASGDSSSYPDVNVGGSLLVATGAADVPDVDVNLGFDEPVIGEEQPVVAVLGSEGDVLTRSDAAERAYDHQLIIKGSGEEPARYFTAATGGIAPDPYTVEKWDSLALGAGGTVSGWVPADFSGSDTFYYTGNLVEFETWGDVSVFIDGHGADMDALNAGYRHSITIYGDGEPANYSFEVSHRLEAAPGTVEQWDSVSETAAEGWVTDPSHEDKYYYDGELTSFEFREGSAWVELDAWGERIDSEMLPYRKEITIHGTGEPSNYAFEVSDELQPVSDSIEQWDSVSERSAEGWVTEESHSDTYRFRGEITFFDLREGDVEVSLTDGPNSHLILNPDELW